MSDAASGRPGAGRDGRPAPCAAAGGRSFAARRASIESALRARLAATVDAIRRYPTPIPACDAQFNYLLEQRSAIPRELARLAAALAAARAPADAARALDAFAASCPYLPHDHSEDR